MRPSKFLRPLVVALAGLGAVALSPARARASQEFPGAIQEAANMPCVPDCKLCHGVSPGTDGTWQNTYLGLSLYSAGARRHDTAKLKAAFKTFASASSTNATNAAYVAALGRGEDPQHGGDICTPTYGCGATLAHQPTQRSPEPAAVVAASLALLTGLFLMRRRR
jgi:hypothetical protein